MNQDVHPSARTDAPHIRLRIAFFLMAAITVGQSFHKMRDTESTILYSVVMLLGVFLAYFGIYRSPGLHFLWGSVCLVSGLGAVTLGAWRWATGSMPPRSFPWWPVVGVSLMLGVGYLLILEPYVRAYRRSLRSYRAPEWQ
jgi:hypothetical protein